MTCSIVCESKRGERSAGIAPVIYWHRELPPVTAEALGEYSLEATSKRVPGTILHQAELWEGCYEDLMKEAGRRLEQEISRLGGNCAHVISESVDSRHDGANNESWLHGSFTYVLYRNLAESHSNHRADAST
jgi:hypothetical protein